MRLAVAGAPSSGAVHLVFTFLTLLSAPSFAMPTPCVLAAAAVMFTWHEILLC